MDQCFQYYYWIEPDTNNDYNKEDVLVSDITEAENNDSNKVFFGKFKLDTRQAGWAFGLWHSKMWLSDKYGQPYLFGWLAGPLAQPNVAAKFLSWLATCYQRYHDYAALKDLQS